MLSAAARPYIEASVPVLREHGLAITTVFYRDMLTAHPELNNLFNQANQANGKQQQSLASAVFAYAANIDNAAALAPVISRIAHKHASLGIHAGHYPIVGRYLLGAIAQTLGDAASPALLAAWAEAYQLLADTLIAAEARLYGASQTQAGDLCEMCITEVFEESADIRSYTLERTDGAPAADFRPGQYVSVAIDLPVNGATRQLRQYSLSDAPGTQSLRISVKREHGAASAQTPSPALPAGQISNWLHRQAKVGTVIKVSAPFGDFTPDTDSDTPLVLLAAGVGVTPMISVLKRIAKQRPQRQVIFAHAVRSAAHHSHQRDLAHARARMPNLQVAVFYAEAPAGDAAPTPIQHGTMHPSRLPQWPLAEADVYLCGPLGFMQEQWQALRDAGVPLARLHREVFGPDLLDHLL